MLLLRSIAHPDVPVSKTNRWLLSLPCYGKVLALDASFDSWHVHQEWVLEVQRDLNILWTTCG